MQRQTVNEKKTKLTKKGHFALLIYGREDFGKEAEEVKRCRTFPFLGSVSLAFVKPRGADFALS